MKLRKTIGRCAPHGLMVRRARSSFYEDYRKWQQSGGRVEWDEESLFRTTVSVDGFGFSGSSAVVDLLREYEDAAVLGYVSPIASQTCQEEAVSEVNFLRYTGGLLQLEQAFAKENASNIYWNDALLKLAMRTFYESPYYQRYPTLRPCFYRFVSEIVDLHLDGMEENVFTPILSLFERTHQFFMLRELSVPSYRLLCRKMLQTFFNHFYQEGRSTLVLDQVVADCRFREEAFRDYFAGFRHIVVYRDPRDVYATALLLNASWIPRDVDDFIKWVRHSYQDFDTLSTDYLVVRFEELVTDYERQVSRIEDYLGLPPANHVRLFQNFNPKVSEKYIGQWSRQPALADTYDKIAKAFPHLIFS